MEVAYLNVGQKDYYKAPVLNHIRGVYEFQLFTKGELFLTYANNVKKVEKKVPINTMLISGPNFNHGWRSPKGIVCDRVVVHFKDIPKSLKVLVKEDSVFEMEFNQEKVQSFTRSVEWLQKKLKANRSLHPIETERELMRISLLILDNIKVLPKVNVVQNVNKLLVENALVTYKEDMTLGVTEVAEFLGYSVAHLRRSFQSIYKKSPLQVFNEYAMDRAAELITESKKEVSDIATILGFSSLSVFSSKFKKHFGKSPLKYREENQVEIVEK